MPVRPMRGPDKIRLLKHDRRRRRVRFLSDTGMHPVMNQIFIFQIKQGVSKARIKCTQKSIRW